ncbi:S1/P1 nuclease [Pseudomonadales bacterium]|nr:S1/P1 nuclease [Pseudomonadales bacterium]
MHQIALKKGCLILLSAVLLILSPVDKASAWGADGHRLICAMAEAKLTPEAKSMLSETLRMGKFLDNNADEDFPEACLWPDTARHTTHKSSYEEHFINVPKSEDSVDLARDCAALNCVATAIQRNLVYLSRDAQGKREKARKAAALRFLAHFVGDLHQPLHVGNGEDWGGNKIRVNWYGKKANLHGIWDYEILKKAGITYPDSLEHLQEIKPEDSTGDVLAWIRTSFRLARNNAYKDTEGNLIASGDTLGDAYFERAKPIVMSQISLSSSRLAYLLNELAAGTLDTNILIVQ